MPNRMDGSIKESPEAGTPPGFLGKGCVAQTVAGLRLVATRCRGCGMMTFPASDVCHKCWSTQFEEVHLDPRGKLYSFSIVHVAPRPWRTPYVLGYVDLPGDVRVLAHIKAPNLSEIEIDMPVQLAVGEVGEQDGHPLKTFVFTPTHRT